MAERGRKRLPDNVHVLRGTFKPSRHGARDKKPLLEPGKPSAPAWLKGAALTEWRRVVRILAPTNVLTVADRTIIAQYCLLFGKMAESLDEFSASDHHQLRSLCSELGLTPASRAKFATGNRKKDDDPFGTIDPKQPG